ncbi:MAG: hypothetical protein ABR95_12790 [Sphingobacteriales bacterium BACL12 MAG-120813-bin55]|jgi:benzil reductase ((S)-benzoin forming)|nr:MAG: hypothetical protein ABR95_12790 [Sphingobacteriales bacterium BACL12 MAG-120813-bin55]
MNDPKEIWIVTGSSKGLGRALVELLAAQTDVQVFGIARSLVADTGNYTHITADLSDSQQLLNLELPKAFHAERVVLVNNAATLGEVRYTGAQDDATIVNSYVLNVAAPHVLANKVLQASQEVREVVIVNISSGAATSAYDGWSLYCAAKAAIQMQARVMQREAEQSGRSVRVYAIAPGVLDTDMQTQLRQSDVTDFSSKEKFMQLHQEGQLRSPALAAQKIIDIATGAFLPPDNVYRLDI